MNPDKMVYESRAKLMVSGEYLVLKGTQSLALPLHFSQRLTIEATDGDPVIHWQSLLYNQVWLTATFALPDFDIIRTSSASLAATLSGILTAAKTLRPGFPGKDKGYRVTSEMNFDPAWGMGSSSSLVSNIAYWADCDPFLLNRMLSPGSGYDIACSRSSHPIIYRLNGDRPEYRRARFQPQFSHNLWFVYLNRKQQTGQSIQTTDLSGVKREDLEAVSALTLEMEKAGSLRKFQSLMNEHEALTGRILQRIPVGQTHFDDFNGAVKSSGSWGGDFILAASEAPEEYVRNYFSSRNFRTIFSYHEIVLNEDEKHPATGSSVPGANNAANE
jgi:mevalonate kinase